MTASLSFDSAYRQIRRGDLSPVYYVTGPEDILKDELVDLVLQTAVEPSTRDFNLDLRSAGDLDAERFTALVETPPMLAERRVVVVRNIEQWRVNSNVWQTMQRYVANPSPMTVLILVHGADQKPAASLSQASCHVNVEALRPDRLARWVNNRAERAGITLEPDAAAHLVEAAGPNLAPLGMEIEKLAAAARGTTVDARQVADLVGVRRGETARDWVAAVLARDAVRACQMLGTVLESAGTTGVRLVTNLGTELVGVRLARAQLDAGLGKERIERNLLAELRKARPSGLGEWKETAASWIRAAGRWTGPDLDRALQTAFEADRALKSTTIADEFDILYEMVLRMGARKAAA
jgi:DNA polymerase-3 subunit delta